MSTFTTIVKTTLSPIALCLSLAITAPAMANRDHPNRHDGMRKILSELSLTDTQRQDIKQIMKQSRDDREIYDIDASALKTQLRALVHASEWDQVAVENVINQHQTQLQDKALQRATSKNQVWKLLTEAQQAKFVAQLETRQAKQAQKHAKGQSTDKSKVRQLRGLDFTDEQRAAVESIQREAKESGETIKTRLENYKKAERSLIHSPDFNSEAWQELSSKYQADFMAMAILRTKSKHDIWNLMTPEQQAGALKKQQKGKGGNKGRKHQRPDSL